MKNTIHSLNSNLPFVSELLQADIRLFIKASSEQASKLFKNSNLNESSEEKIYTYNYYRPNQDSLYMDLESAESQKQGQILESHKDMPVHKAFEMGKPVIGQYGLVVNNRPIQEFAYPIFHKNKAAAVIAIERDIYLTRSTLGRYWELIADNLIKALQTKISAKQKLPNVDLGEGALVLDQKQDILFANPLAIKLLSELVEHGSQLIGKNLEETLASYSKKYKGQNKESSIISVNEIDLNQRTINLRHIAINDDMSVVLIKDFSEIKIKETLLREIHHRVKNNLQTVASLLRMQKRRNPELRDAFKEAMNRVHSMSLVHEFLATGDNVELIDFGFLSNKIIRELVTSFGLEGLKMNFHCPEKILINSDKATNLALVINELVSNSLEHGGEKLSELSIAFYNKKKNFEIEIEDDGDGFPKDFDYKKSTGLGWEIIRTITEDSLKAKVSVTKKKQSGGSKVKLEIAKELLH